MEMISLLTRALWVSAIVLLVLWTGRYIYRKLTPKVESFFYLLTVDKADGSWMIRVESPRDDLVITISLYDAGILTAERRVLLKQGINRITLRSPALKHDQNMTITLSSDDQKLERRV